MTSPKSTKIPKQFRKSPFPVLYKVTSKGKTRVWLLACQDDTVWRTDGDVGGKLKDPSAREFEGNTLRSPEEQAQLEAEKKWIAQLDKGYEPASNDKKGRAVYDYVMTQKAANGNMNRGVRMWAETGIKTGTTAGKKAAGEQHYPMLAKKYLDHKNKVKFPGYLQAKVDGLRALPRVTGKHVYLESRKGKDYVHLEHIREEISDWLHKKNCPDLVLDGEFYVHQLYRDSDGNPTLEHTPTEFKGVERYQFLSKACKITRTNPQEHEFLVEFWVFDLWDLKLTFEERWQKLVDLFHDYPGDVIKLVPTYKVNSHEEIEAHMQNLIGETAGRNGYEYEGVMIRDAQGSYIAKNDHHCDELLKYKRFEDEEWPVASADECAGNQKGAIKWICQKKVNGVLRKVTAKQIGPVPESRKLWRDYQKNPAKYIGRMINLRFNERTKDGIPRFPRATAFREDI